MTLADGTEHDVRATSSKVWTDLELPEHPDRVVLRVLEESERSQPVPPQALVAGPPPSGGSASVDSGDAATPVAPDAPVDASATPSTTDGGTRGPVAVATGGVSAVLEVEPGPGPAVSRRPGRRPAVSRRSARRHR